MAEWSAGRETIYTRPISGACWTWPLAARPATSLRGHQQSLPRAGVERAVHLINDDRKPFAKTICPSR